MSKTIVLRPRLSEKTYGLSLTRNTYTFNVPADANKHTVARAVAAQFDVVVEEVNIINVKGKAKRTIRKGGRASQGRQSDVKKAYVTLAEGNSIPVFATEETSEAPAEVKTDAKAEKKADKKKEKK